MKKGQPTKTAYIPLYCNGSKSSSNLESFCSNQNGGTKFIETMNEAEAKNQAAIALKELNKALLLIYPFRNEGWALDFLDEVNSLSVKY